VVQIRRQPSWALKLAEKSWDELRTSFY